MTTHCKLPGECPVYAGYLFSLLSLLHRNFSVAKRIHIKYFHLTEKKVTL